MAEKLKVFLCHASENKKIANNLFERLKSDGFDPWLDSDNILPGMDWDLEIQKAMRASDVVIVCFSKISLEKEGYVQKEIKFAIEIQKEKPEGTIFLIPVQLEECDIPSSLKDVQWGKYYENDGYEKIIKALNKRASHLKQKKETGRTTMSSNKRENKSFLINLEKGCALIASTATILGFCLVVFIFLTGKEFFPEFFNSTKPNVSSPQATDVHKAVTPYTSSEPNPQSTNITQLDVITTTIPVQNPSPTINVQTVTSMPSPATATATATATLKIETIPWQGKYYNNENFREPSVFERNDNALVFDWGKSNPAPNMPTDNFTVRWEKCTEFEERYYTFTATTGYYSLIAYLDGIEFMDARNGTSKLDYYMPSGKHCITVEYYHTLYDAYVYFDYAPSEKPVSSNSDNPWQGKYYANTEFKEPPAFERDDDTLTFDWGNSNPAPNMPTDYFTIRWRKCANFEERYYTFTATTDYYFLIAYVDDIKILEARNGTETLDYYMPGGNHCIKVEYSHTLYDAYVYFNYK